MSKIDELIQKLCPNGVEYKTIGDIATYRRGSFPQPYTNSSFYGGEGAMPFVQVADIEDEGFVLKEKTKQTISKVAQPKSIFVPKGNVICSIQGTIGRVAITQYDAYVDRTIAIFEGFKIDINKRFFAYCIQVKFGIEKQFARGSTLKTITKEEFTKFCIPVPPLEVQDEIVRILDDFTLLSAELKARKKQYEYYLKEIIKNSNIVAEKYLWEITIWDKKFNSVEKFKQNQTIKYTVMLASDLFKLQQNEGSVFLLSTGEQTGWTTEEIAKGLISEGEVVTIPWGKSRPLKEVMKYYKGKFVTGDNRIATSNDTKILNNKFLYYWFISQSEKIDKFYRGAGIQHPNMKNILDLKIKLPSIEEQNRIVDFLDKLERLIIDITDGLPAEIGARQKQYEYYRDKLLTFKELVNEG